MIDHATGLDVREALSDEIAGTVITPGDASYDEARRVWNGMIDRRPAAIVQAGNTADIAPVLRVARELELALAVRGGGHNVAGNGTVDDGIVLDLGGLKSVEVDPEADVVRVAPGVTLGEMDRATEPHARVVVTGVVSGTGVAGLTLGGGVGWLTRTYGLAVDNLVSADVVTASGETLRASESENAELFWGLRGGGGNFGVVTSFTFRSHPLGPSVFGGTFVYERPRWGAAMRAWTRWTDDLPDAMNSIVTFVVPPESWEMGSEPLLLVGFAWANADHAEGERVVAPLRAAASPDTEVLEPTTWVAWQSAVDEMFPKGSRAYWKNAPFDRFDDDAVDALVGKASELTWQGTAVDVHHMGGAFGRVPEAVTSFPGRGAGYWLNVYGYWSDPADDDRLTAWVRALHAAVAPFAMEGQYVNFMGREGKADARAQALAAYGPAKLERLVALKRRYDPGNLFRLNHNIPPG